ncbi:DUF402 domain-containing protein [Corynebacterium sp. HS2168-gen11]|uniref:DUF402 domain-containing protein n=1 Tax=Corynebacterium sp. HS2168-gen11 TaxID=2974027 RepID=UPI00216B155D|nr:DUF402 domain-containing protein [Corynebacterium sp. HS2168-gen11]MCS4534935.1 DUF402 domain-containing protein [Corynebacterium sp. HS2168-gen11]
MVDTHPVKQETFDTRSKINIDPKGFHRSVDTFRETEFGLYMARGADHQFFGYVESWLLPKLGLRINIFHYRDGVQQTEKFYDFYIDVVDIAVDTAGVWTTRDLYVDLLWNIDTQVEVVDIDELAAATSEGLITADDAEKAIETTLMAVDGITRYGDNPLEWIKSQGYELDWATEVELTPAQ